MPLYISITPKEDAGALANSLRHSIRMAEDGKWFVNENGDFQRKLEPGDARTSQAFHPVVENQKLRLVFTNEGVYEPSDYADYYGDFVKILIKEHRNKFTIIRVMFDDKEGELDVQRESIEDQVFVGLPVREIKSALGDTSVDADKRIEKALKLIEMLGY